MESNWENLDAFVGERPLRRRLLLAPSRSVGRRLLAQCARRGVLVVGVEAHSLFTLALELCGGEKLRFLTRLQTEEEVAWLLSRTEDPLLARPAFRTPGAAGAVWRLLEELELHCCEPVPTEDQPLLRSLLSFGATLRKELAERGLLTRPALYRLALEKLEWGEIGAPAQQYARLSTVELTPLEEQLWQRLTGGAAEVIPVPERDVVPLAEGLKGRCRFVRCRGRENELRWLFADLARRGEPLDRSVVAVTGPDYGLSLWREGLRLGVPVAVDGGIPLRHSALFGLLEGLSDWRESGYEAERFLPLLSCAGFQVAGKGRLQKELRRRKICWQKERYALVWAPQEGDTEELTALRRDWEDLFARLFAALEPGAGQKEALRTLLLERWQTTSRESAAAGLHTRSLLEQLEPQPERSILEELLRVVGDSRYLTGSPGGNILYCGSLEQCPTAGTGTLYVLGLDQSSLEERPAYSPFLSREERRALGLPERTGTSPWAALERLLSGWEGEVVLIRPDFTVAELQEQPPAPFYEELLALCGGTEEFFGFPDMPPLPTAAAPAPVPTSGDSPEEAEVVEEPEEQDTVTFPNLRVWVERHVFSATALERALECPYRFYLEYVLNLRQPQPVRRPLERWLEPGPFGTLVHQVLEDYFGAMKDGKTSDPRALLEERAAELRTTEPPAPPERMAADAERAWLYIERAIGDFDPAHRVAGTEYAFGQEDGGLPIQIGKYTIHIQGSIDRLDRLPDGTYAVVDYKTGDSKKYRDHPQRYVQPLLYTLAAQALLREGARVSQAGYLFLKSEEDRALVYPQTEESLRDGVNKLEALLDWLCAPEGCRTKHPCFTWDGTALEPGSDKERADHRACGTFCPYRELCGEEG